MRVEFNPRQNKTSFEANITKEFEDSMRLYINSRPNRLKNNYKLNEQIENIKNFGFNDYTIGLTKRFNGNVPQYTLRVAKNGTSIEKGFVIAKRHNYGWILDFFLNMNKRQFQSILSQQNLK